jgi:4-carboxymuconolactone decarboxylase
MEYSADPGRTQVCRRGAVNASRRVRNGSGTKKPNHADSPSKITSPRAAAAESARTERGLALMREMLGEDLVSSIAARNTIAPDWHRWTTGVLFGDLWQDATLSRAQRSMITVAALVPMSRGRELGNHLRAALVNGVTVEELVAVVCHVGFYGGWPAAGEALAILRSVVDEQANGDE